jgi:hypothetical protein
MSQLVTTKRQDIFKDFKGFEAFKPTIHKIVV